MKFWPAKKKVRGDDRRKADRREPCITPDLTDEISHHETQQIQAKQDYRTEKDQLRDLLTEMIGNKNGSTNNPS